MPDEKFLKTKLRAEFGMDSLDFEEMFYELYNQCGIIMDIYGHQPLPYYPFGDEPTVENFIETVNCYLSQKN